jgi:hypothetical protein
VLASLGRVTRSRSEEEAADPGVGSIADGVEACDREEEECDSKEEECDSEKEECGG